MFKREIGQSKLLLMSSFRVREEVFVEEQNISKSLLTDENDDKAHHCIIYDFGIPVGTARLYLQPDGYHIGRVAISKSVRGKGLGKDLMTGLIERAWSLGADKVIVNSQEQVIEFYEKLGFKPVGEKFIEANIVHLRMEVYK